MPPALAHHGIKSSSVVISSSNVSTLAKNSHFIVEGHESKTAVLILASQVNIFNIKCNYLLSRIMISLILNLISTVGIMFPPVVTVWYAVCVVWII